MEHVTGGTSSPGLKSGDSVPQVVEYQVFGVEN